MVLSRSMLNVGITALLDTLRTLHTSSCLLNCLSRPTQEVHRSAFLCSCLHFIPNPFCNPRAHHLLYGVCLWTISTESEWEKLKFTTFSIADSRSEIKVMYFFITCHQYSSSYDLQYACLVQHWPTISWLTFLSIYPHVNTALITSPLIAACLTTSFHVLNIS